MAREPAPPPHPLSRIEAKDIASVARLTADGPEPLAGDALTQAASAIGALRTMPAIDSRSVTWGSATMLRAVTHDGVAVSLQVKPIGDGAAVRVTADNASHDKAVDAEAAAIRTLRLNAYRVGPPLAQALLQSPASPPDEAR